MAPNLRCTGRQELWCSQIVLAPLSVMNSVLSAQSEKVGLDVFS